MRAAPFAIALALVPAAAPAAERAFPIGSFERIRVSGPFEVRVATAASPRATASGDPSALDRLAIEVQGSTLTVRAGPGLWDDRGRPPTTPVVALTTPRLVSVTVQAGGRVTAERLAGDKVELAVNGSGRIAVAAAEAQDLAATLIGTGEIAVAGRAQRARLLTNGAGRIDAPDLDTSELTVRLDGSGETRARARYNAAVISTGLGRVTVEGNAKCTVKAVAGPVTCGPKL
jgi:hypothetical protein